MNEKLRLSLVLGAGFPLTSVVAVGVTAISLFSGYLELEDLGRKLDEDTLGRIVGMTAADRFIMASGAILFVTGVTLIITGMLRRNSRPL